MFFIYINSKFVIATVTALAGVAGIGYGISAEKKRQKKKENVNHSAVKSTVADVMNESAQEVVGQVDAVVVEAVNAVRINQLLEKITMIDCNKAGAEEEIRLLKAEVQRLLTNNRGGVKGIHGFIGETSQVHISNIKAFINGDEPLYILLDDNSMTDYTRGIQIIQQKACRADGHLGLDAIKRHMEKYPEFIKQGGIYQIPKDMYEKYDRLKNLSEEIAMKLRKEDLRLWKYIRSFTENNSDVVIEPMEVSYADIQAGNIEDTVKRVKDNTDREFEKQYKDAHDAHVPTFEEFLKVCCISAAIEGGVNAGTEFVQKLKSGKKLSEFTKQDVKDIAAKFAIGNGKGAFRSGIVYFATNIYKIPAAVISGAVTALFGITYEGYLMFKKKITTKQFVKNSLFVAFETAASTTGASLGKNLCKKHPVIGAIVGSIIGSAGIRCIRRTAFA